MKNISKKKKAQLQNKVKLLFQKAGIAVVILLACYGLYKLLGFGYGGNTLKEKLELDGDESPISMFKFLAICIILSLAIGGPLIVFLLPRVAESIASSVLGQSSQPYVEPNSLERARGLILQERYRDALKGYREVIEEMKEEELTDMDGEKEASIWLEMSQLQARNLVDRKGAIETLKEGLESKAWEEEDEISFMLRLAELYVADDFTKSEGEKMYKLLIEKFPENEYHVKHSRAELLKMRKKSNSIKLEVVKSPPRPSHSPTKML